MAKATTYDFEADAGLGLDAVRHDDVLMPRLKLLQSGSPEVKPRDPAYIEGAQEGRWLDVVRHEVFDEFIFVVTRYERQFMEWTPITSGGGLVANWGGDDHRLKDAVRNEKGIFYTAEGTQVIPTMTFWGYIVGTIDKKDSPIVPCQRQVFIAMSSTHAKVASRWVTDMTSIQIPKADGKGRFTPPSYYLSYRVACIGQQNEQNSWVIPTFERAGLTADLYPDMLPEFKNFAIFLTDQKNRNVALDEQDETIPRKRLEPGQTMGEKIDDDLPF